jgi:hypothetical protein
MNKYHTNTLDSLDEILQDTIQFHSIELAITMLKDVIEQNNTDESTFPIKSRICSKLEDISILAKQHKI